MWRPEFALLAFQSQSMCALFFVNVLYGNIRLRGRLRAIHFQSWQACNVHKLFTGNSTLAALTNTHTHTYTGCTSTSERVARERARARTSSCYTNTNRFLYGSRVTRMLLAMIDDDVWHVRFVWMARYAFHSIQLCVRAVWFPNIRHSNVCWTIFICLLLVANR